jgi:hypothetical protein
MDMFDGVDLDGCVSMEEKLLLGMKAVLYRNA